MAHYVPDFHLERLDCLPDRMELQITSYSGFGVHYYAKLVGPASADTHVQITLTRPTLLIERERDPRFERMERTEAFLTKAAAINRAIKFAQEHQITLWQKEWYVVQDERYEEHERCRAKVLWEPKKE